MAELFTRDRRLKRNRFYQTATWRKIRARKLKPLCSHCLKLGIYKKAVVLDHIDCQWESWPEFCAGPFQSLCQECHRTKTFQEDLPALLRKQKETLKFF